MTPFSAKRQRRNSWLGSSTLEVHDTFSDAGSSASEMQDMQLDLDLPVNGGSSISSLTT